MKNQICFASFDEASAADGSCPCEQIVDAFCIAMGRWHCAEDYAGSSPRADVTSENLLRQLAGQEQAGQRLWPCRTPMESCPSAGLAVQHPWKFTCRDGSCLDLLEGPDGQWKHVIRQALRDMVLQEKVLA